MPWSFPAHLFLGGEKPWERGWFQSLNRVLLEDTKGFMSPEKFRDVRETGPWAFQIVDSHVHGTNLCLVDDLIPVPDSCPRDCGFYMVDR